MDTDYGGVILVIIAILAISYLAWDTYVVGEVENVKSTVDGRTYSVRSLPDKQEAANLLAEMRERCVRFVGHLNKAVPDDPRAQRLIKGFNPDAMSEGADNAKYTSYSVNKGEKIVFCLRARDASMKLVDINTMMFVALHELSHIATESVGHTTEFWETFKWVLEQSVDVGVYIQVDYKKDPIKYCGVDITSNPAAASVAAV
jgi:hypothetical protein